MTNITVLEKENLGQETKVTVQIESSVILSVNRKLISTDYSPGDYHDSLHTERIDHDHNSRVYKLTLWMDNPYTSEKLNNLLVDQIADIESVSHLDYLNPIHDVQETCIVNGVSRNHYHISKCPKSVTDALITSFPEYDLTKIALISSPAYHEIVKQTVISVFLKENTVPIIFDGDIPLIGICRKYCLESGKYYDRHYGFIESSDVFNFIPDSCTLLSKSYNSNIQSGLVIPDFYDVYFSGDPEIVEEAFDVPHNVGSDRTYYAVTVQNNAVVRVKQYCYEEFTLFSDWDETVAREKASHNLT
jgi:hypothetical protein